MSSAHSIEGAIVENAIKNLEEKTISEILKL